MEIYIKIEPTIAKRTDLTSDMKLILTLLDRADIDIWLGLTMINDKFVDNRVNIDRIMSILGLSETKVLTSIRKLNKLGLVSVTL